MGERTAARRFLLTLLALFAAVATALAGLGLYGVVAFAVSQRGREIGVRMALGAESGRVVRMVLGEGARLIAAGVAIGTGSALALGRSLSGLLFEVRATDPATYAGVATMLVFFGLLACWLPARRASRTNPIEALRSE
jgi:ABC-type antimicrobial peptide transport system permease subunit